MTTFNVSETWNNGESRTMTGHHEPDPFDEKVESAAGDNRKVLIDGQGKCTISGDRVRIYAKYKNYDAIMTLTFIPNFQDEDEEDEDDCSLRLRSRHEEQNPRKNRFGGYNLSLTKSHAKAKREEYHNEHTTLGKEELPEPLVNGREYKVRFTCKDVGNKVNLKGEIDYGNGFVEVLEAKDDDPLSYMVNRDLYNNKSYIWIRNNSPNGSVTVKDVQLEVL